MRGCELCGREARMYCESDQANLCWECDEKVHSANFLVEKHSRTLLCHVCQTRTPWSASGSKLGPTVSICQTCFSLHSSKPQQQQQQHDEIQESMSSQQDLGDEGSEGLVSEEEEEDDDDVDEEEEGENQVVPWSPLVAGSGLGCGGCDEEENSGRFSGSSSSSSSSSLSHDRLKRSRDENHDPVSDEDENGCSSIHSFRPSKQSRRTSINNNTNIQDEDSNGRQQQDESTRSMAIVDSLNRLQREMVNKNCDQNVASAVLQISRLSNNQSR